MPTIPRSANLLVDLILENPRLLDQVKTDPEEILPKLAEQATAHLPPPVMVADAWIYRIVVLALSIVCITAVLGTIYLSATTASAQIPDVLTALGAAAIGALAGLLAPTPASK